MRGMESRIVYNAAFSAIGFLAFESARSLLLKAHLERKARRSMRGGEEGWEGGRSSEGVTGSTRVGEGGASLAHHSYTDPGHARRPDRC